MVGSVLSTINVFILEIQIGSSEVVYQFFSHLSRSMACKRPASQLVAAKAKQILETVFRLGTLHQQHIVIHLPH
eukprot:6484050-Amphidinium_carterae.1